MKQINTFKELLIHQLRDLLFSAEQMTKILPKLANLSQDSKVQKILGERVSTSNKHCELLRNSLKQLNAPEKSVVCHAMIGLIKEGDHLLDEIEDREVRDAAVIAVAQRMQHYEIAGYGTAKSHAMQLDEMTVAENMDTILENEKKIDKKLTKIAESSINKKALATA